MTHAVKIAVSQSQRVHSIQCTDMRLDRPNGLCNDSVLVITASPRVGTRTSFHTVGSRPQTGCSVRSCPEHATDTHASKTGRSVRLCPAIAIAFACMACFAANCLFASVLLQLHACIHAWRIFCCSQPPKCKREEMACMVYHKLEGGGA